MVPVILFFSSRQIIAHPIRNFRSNPSTTGAVRQNWIMHVAARCLHKKRHCVKHGMKWNGLEWNRLELLLIFISKSILEIILLLQTMGRQNLSKLDRFIYRCSCMCKIHMYMWLCYTYFHSSTEILRLRHDYFVHETDEIFTAVCRIRVSVFFKYTRTV